MPRPTKQATKQATKTAPKQTTPAEKKEEYSVTYPTRLNPFTGEELPVVPSDFNYKGITREEVEQQFYLAFELIGGSSRFAKWAHVNPDKFYNLYAKLLPEPEVKSSTPTEIAITLKNGNNLPSSPLDVVDVRDESVVNARYLKK